MSQAVVRAQRIEFDVFAQVCEIHPELLDRLIELGLLEAVTDAEGHRWLARRQVAALARIRRLHAGLRLSYSAIAVVADLIDRIDELENQLRWFEANSPTRRPPRDTDSDRGTKR